jgi:hypothetical protein
MEEKFKVGDRIKLLDYSRYEYPEFKDQPASIIGVSAGSSFQWRIRWDNGATSCVATANIKLAGRVDKIVPPRFILQYELDQDPFELFATEKEVRARIKELAERHDLKRDSIKIYEIKNTRKVVLGTSIKFTK